MEWKFIVKRNLSLLFCELITLGQTKQAMKELLDVDFGFDHYRAIEGKVAYTIEEIKDTNRNYKELYLKYGPKIFKTFIEK